MSTDYPSLNLSDVEDWVDPSSFKKGQAYFRQGAILEPRRQGMKLKARCLGSSAPSYQVEATLSPKGIASADCSCPVGDGGHCKHVAALLLTWLDDPESFRKIEDLQASLERRSKTELIALIRQMLQRDPELEILLELPLPGDKASQKPIDPKTIQRQAEHAFRGLEGERSWGGLSEIALELDALMELAGQYLVQEDPANAASIYRVVAATVLEHEYVVMGDEAGRLGGVVHECAEGLGRCLEAIQDKAERERILQALFEIYVWDVNMGGIGIGDNVPDIFQEQAMSTERQLISEWVQAALPGKRDWGNEILGGLWLDLQGETLDDEAYLEICRQTGRLNDLVERLLQLGRVAEAVGEARQAGDFDLLSLANRFVANNYGSPAEQLVRERVKTSQDSRLTFWLKEYVKKRGDLKEALALAEVLFWQRP